jgi:hypothetical protein
VLGCSAAAVTPPLPACPRCGTDTSDAIHHAASRSHPPRNYPKTTGPRRHATANEPARGRETTATTPLRPGLPPIRNTS